MLRVNRLNHGSPDNRMSLKHWLLPASIGCCLLIRGIPAAAADGAWFGIEMPEKRSARAAQLDAAYRTPDFPSLSLPAPPAGDRYADIRGAQLLAFLQDIVQLTHRHRPRDEPYWGRIAGTAAELAAADYVLQRFGEFGLQDTRSESVEGGPQWWPESWSVTLLANPAYGKATADYSLSSAFPALQLGGAPLAVDALEAELIYVGSAHAVDLLGRDLRGKIAVVHARLQPDTFFQSARGHVDAVIEAGAVAVITVMDAPGNHQYALEDMGPPEVPCLILGGDDGRFLLDVIAAAGRSPPPRMRIAMKTAVRESWSGRNVVGIVPGTGSEYVIVLAHLDGYFESANDNGGGLASLLALAQHYSRADAPRMRRNLLFLATSGHHEVSDGARSFIEDHPEILANTAVVMNIEHPASVMSYYRGPLRFKNMSVPGQLSATNTLGTRSLTVSNDNALLKNLYRAAVDRHGLVIDALIERRPPSGDAYDFFKARQVVVQILDSSIWYHSSGDRMESIPPVGLERATRVYAEVLDGIDRHERAELVRRGGP
ncbi:MAG: M28 family peptidase [Gammaproteobacteria bacterium]|nr:M28 family peptidase [Gammaproteobacteria bacterium]